MMSADWVGRQVANTTFTGALTIPTVKEIIAQDGSFFIDNAGTAAGTTTVTGLLLSWSLTVNTGWKRKWTIDTGNRFFNFHYFDKDSVSAELSMTFEHDAKAVTEKALFRSGGPRVFRIKVNGPPLGTNGTTYQTKLLQIDMAAVYTAWEAVDSDEGNSIVNVTAQMGYDPTAALGLGILVVNELTAIP